MQQKEIDSNDLSLYDKLECPHCETLTPPQKVKKDGSVVYVCPECEEKFIINAKGELVE